MNFKQWLAQFKTNDTPLGDLARDVQDDRNFPLQGDEISFTMYLQEKKASKECMEVFGEAFERYFSESGFSDNILSRPNVHRVRDRTQP